MACVLPSKRVKWTTVPPLHDYRDGYAAEFDLPINGDNGEPDKFEVMADALAWVLAYCWLGPNGRTRECKAAFKRFVAIAMTVRPDLFGDMSFEMMGKKLRFTKAALSKLSLDFSDKAGLHFRRNRRQDARKKFRDVQTKLWAEKHLKSVTGPDRRAHPPS